MADRGRRCDHSCGCAVPCPGDVSCRCAEARPTSGEGGAGVSHSTCRCGEHCGCNPCTCEKGAGATAGIGRTACSCGTGCNCATCKS